MRLIDADAIRYTDLNADMPQSKVRVWVSFKERIDAMPTIEERKKGKWIAHPNKEFKEWDVCTACGVGCKRREYEDGGMTQYNYPFCPNCGADMRGEEDEL